MKYFEERINGEVKRLYQESVGTHGWCVEINGCGIRLGAEPSTIFSLEEAKEMVDWINKNLPKKVYVLHKEYDYNPLEYFSGGDLYFKQEDIKEEYR